VTGVVALGGDGEGFPRGSLGGEKVKREKGGP